MHVWETGKHHKCHMGKVKVKLSLGLTKYYAIKMYPVLIYSDCWKAYDYICRDRHYSM